MSINETKPWYESTTIWAGIAQILLTVLSVPFDWSVTPADGAQVGLLLGQVFTGVLGLLAILGRLRATKRIG